MLSPDEKRKMLLLLSPRLQSENWRRGSMLLQPLVSEEEEEEGRMCWQTMRHGGDDNASLDSNREKDFVPE